MKNILAIILVTVTSCGGQSKEANQKKITPIKTETNVIGGRAVISFEPDSLNNFSSHYLLEKFSKEYEGLVDKDITKVKLVNSVSIKNFGVAQVYNITLSDNLPEVFSKSNYLIVNRDKKQAALFLLDTLVFIKTSVNDNTVLLAGVERIKSKGFFLMYDYVRENKFEETLNTTDSCGNGIPVFNNSIECISYKPFMLAIKNIDINNDGTLDINFSGQIASYCKALETGYGRNDRLPININEINFSLVLKPDINNHFRYNFFPQGSICNLIK